MANAKITYFLVILQAAFADSKLYNQKGSFFTRLAGNRVLSQSNNPEGITGTDEFRPIFPIDSGSDSDSESNRTMAEPEFAGKSGKFRSVREKGEDEEEDEDEGEDESPDFEDGGTNDWDDDWDNEKGEIDFPDGEKKTKKNKKGNEEDESDYDDEDIPQFKHIKHFFKHKVKVKDLMFFLLLVYKVKLVTLIPLLLGAKILLVGATTMAGFFFALFASAIGLQTKSNHR